MLDMGTGSDSRSLFATRGGAVASPFPRFILLTMLPRALTLSLSCGGQGGRFTYRRFFQATWGLCERYPRLCFFRIR